MPTVRLKGLNKATKRLADGTTATYWYAWRGGPKLEGKPGSNEFMASYQRALATRAAISDGTVLALIRQYRASAEFGKVRERSKKEYTRYLGLIEAEFGDMPLAAVEDKRSRADFLGWRDTMQDRPRTADFAWMVLNRLLNWAKERHLITINPCERAGRLYEADRTEAVWTAEDFAALFAVCSPEIRWAVRLAVLTGQRQSDLLTLTWNRIGDTEIRIQQSKTGRRVTIELYPELRALLAEIPKRATTVLTSSRSVTQARGTKQPWTSHGFKASFRKARNKAGVKGRTFHDLRGTAITNFAMRGMTALEIAALAGWTEKDVSELLDRHYLGGRADLARAAVRRCLGNESGPDFSNRLQTDVAAPTAAPSTEVSK